MLALIAEELAGVLLHLLVVVRGGGVLLLSADERLKHVNSVVLISADAAVENLLDAAGGIEVPLAAAVLHQADGQRPVVGAHIEGSGLVRLDHDAMHLVVVADEVRDCVFIGYIVAGMQNLIGVGAKYRVQSG